MSSFSFLLLSVALACSTAQAKTSAAKCLVVGSGIERVNSLFTKTGKAKFTSDTTLGIGLERVKVKKKDSFFWRIHRKKMTLYTSTAGPRTKLPPRDGWTPDDDVKPPAPIVDCTSPVLALPASGDRAAALCPKRGGLCGIVLLKGPRDVVLEQQLDVINQTIAAEAKKFGKFNWLWTNGECQSAFAKTFGVDSDKLPSIVVLNAAKSRYAQFVGAFQVKSIMEFISGVMSGHLRTSKLRGNIPVLEDLDCMFDGGPSGGQQGEQGGQGEDPHATDSIDDATDIAAEIRKEEEVAKKELEKEVVRQEQTVKDAEKATRRAAAEKKEQEKEKVEEEERKQSKKARRKKRKKKMKKKRRRQEL